MANLEIQRFSRGSTARLFLEILAAGAGQTNESPTIAIRRLSDGLWFDGAAFVPTLQSNAVEELDAPNLPGLYFFDFDHALDTTASNEFMVRFANTGANALLEHFHVIFGRLTDTVDPGLCSIIGTIFTADGKRSPNALVEATVIPVETDALGRGFQNLEVMRAYTDQLGEFELPLAQTLSVRLQIGAIGYDRKIVVPAQASALFTDL